MRARGAFDRPPTRRLVALVAAALIAAVIPATASAEQQPNIRELTTFAAPGCASGCGSGSTVGPDGALYVTDGPGGRVLRVDPRTGAPSTFASGLPQAIPEVGLGGAMDVVFRGRSAYVLVTLVGPAFGQPEVVNGIYRIGRDGTATPIADLGAWSVSHPPATDSFIASGLQYALERYRDGFVVTDGHHNRVLRVSLDGHIRPILTLGNVVPTGLEVFGETIFMGQAGPIPHAPADGKVVRFGPWSTPTEVASGASLIVDVELGPDWRLYGLSQGSWDLPPTPENEGKPASPNTGKLLRVKRHGGLEPVVEGLDRPTSLEFIRDSAFVVTLTGKVMRIDHARCNWD